jgi:hypothetical protein
MRQVRQVRQAARSSNPLLELIVESLQRARRLRPPAARDSYAFENVLAVEVKGKVLRNEPAPSTASQANQETRMRRT